MKNIKILLLLFVFMFFSAMVSAQIITVTSPSKGAIWFKGSTHNITWTKSGPMNAKVKIILYKAFSTTKILDITNETNNDGNYSWTIPGSIPAGSYEVKVITIDDFVFDHSRMLTIKSLAVLKFPLQVYTPGLNSYHFIGFNVHVKWRTSRLPGKLRRVKIDIRSARCLKISKRGVLLKRVYGNRRYKLNRVQIDRLIAKPWTFEILRWRTITASTYDDGSYFWKVPLYFKKGCYKIRITRLWGSREKAESRVFHLLPLVIVPPPAIK